MFLQDYKCYFKASKSEQLYGKYLPPSDIEQAENYVVSALDSHMAGEDVKTSKSQPYGCGVKY